VIDPAALRWISWSHVEVDERRFSLNRALRATRRPVPALATAEATPSSPSIDLK
jgi:hypothetical protein